MVIDVADSEPFMNGSLALDFCFMVMPAFGPECLRKTPLLDNGCPGGITVKS